MALWSPVPAGVQRLIEIFQSSSDPSPHIQTKIVQDLNELSQREDFPLYLLHIFNLTDLSPTIRQCSGLHLKSVIKNYYSSFPENIKIFLKSEILRSITDPAPQVRTTTGILITKVVECEEGSLNTWPALLPGLLDLISRSDDLLVHGGLNAIEKLCEDHFESVQNITDRSFERLIPKLIDLLVSPHEEFRRASLHSINQFLLDMPGSFLVNLNPYLQAIFRLASDNSPQIRLLVCNAFTALVERKLENVRPFLSEIVNYMLAHTTPETDPSLALEACEFWITISDTEAAVDLVPLLPKLLLSLLNCLVMTDLEIQMLCPGQSGKQENLQFVGSTITPDPVSDWTLRKCAGIAFQTLSSEFDDFLPAFLPLFQEPLPASGDWRVLEARLFAIGSVADGCGDGMANYFPFLIPYLTEQLSHQQPPVRRITCWSLGEYSFWICSRGAFFQPVLDHLLPCVLDSSKDVRIASTSALASLLEGAGDIVAPFTEMILTCLVTALEQYPPEQTRHLYDPMATLVEVTSDETSIVLLEKGLLPRLMNKLLSVENSDLAELAPLYGCFGSLATLLKVRFQSAVPFLYERCILIMQECLLNPDDTEEEEMLIDAMSFLTGILGGLGGDLLPLFQNSPVGNILFSCLKSEVVSIRKTALSLVGDIAKSINQFFDPVRTDLMGILVENLPPHDPELCNNSAWAIVALAMTIREEIGPFLVATLQRFVFVIENAVIHPVLVSSICLALGHLCLAAPGGMSKCFDIFLPHWCENIAEAENSDEKEVAFEGVCMAVKENPGGILSHFEPLCSAFFHYKGDASPSSPLFFYFRKRKREETESGS